MQERKQPVDALSLPRHKSNAVIKIEQGSTLDDIANGTPGAPRLIGCLDMTDPADRRLFLKTAGNDDIDVDRLKGEPFPLCKWTCEAAKVMDDKKGELVVVPRICMFNADGGMMSFTAWSITRFLDKLRVVVGEGPYDPPINIKFRRVDTGGGKMAYECDVVE